MNLERKPAAPLGPLALFAATSTCEPKHEKAAPDVDEDAVAARKVHLGLLGRSSYHQSLSSPKPNQKRARRTLNPLTSKNEINGWQLPGSFVDGIYSSPLRQLAYKLYIPTGTGRQKRLLIVMLNGTSRAQLILPRDVKQRVKPFNRQSASFSTSVSIRRSVSAPCPGPTKTTQPCEC